MKPLFHPFLVNGPFEDPALYVEFLFERRALLFDLGEINALPARKVLRLGQIFVSHTHMDHFVGLDRVVRICLGRARAIDLFGPPGFISQVESRLAGYTWNLVANYHTDFTLTVTEVNTERHGLMARFRCRTGFAREDLGERAFDSGILHDEPAFRVRCAILDHRIPCLAFALEEKRHVNVWKNRLRELDLPTGPWLRVLKEAVQRNAPDTTPIAVPSNSHPPRTRVYPLGKLKRRILRLVPGQKIAYVVDTVYHPRNLARIAALASGADVLYIEAPFLDELREVAAEKYHLTAAQAGRIARAAAVKRVVPFHFSARHHDREEALREEVQRAFGG